MSAKRDIRLHEVTFCNRVSKWSEAAFRANPSLPFERVEIEESKSIRRKRSDLRVYDRNGTVLAAGEVKMPGTPQGRTPFDFALLKDAHEKAHAIGARFFFTWNINRLLLFDRSLWQRPLPEQRVADFDLHLQLDSPEEAGRPEVEARIQQFLGEFYQKLALIASGDDPDWGLKPDEFFLRALRSHIDWPVRLTAEWLGAQSAKNKTFRDRLRGWMTEQPGWVISDDERTWRDLVDRSARTLCYVFSNRLIFYESVRARFTRLKPIKLPPTFAKPQEAEAFFNKRFEEAVRETGDYETIFYPGQADWASWQIFCHAQAAEAWRSVVENLRQFNFREIRTDILGGIFQKLIAPAERQRFGQFYTNEHLVDLINAFCIRRAADTVLDPACGSGSFLVRAYERKHTLDPTQSHQQRLAQIYGSDIALFAAHLATLNLAARQINEEENYPRIARRDFFELRPGAEFCRLPGGLHSERHRLQSITLPELDAVVGNPPYVKQERIPKKEKLRYQELLPQLWPGLKFSGRSDLHLYFWPLAARMLKPDGWFGFLVSSSWLDVEYGFALQRWLLQNFKIHAIVESQAEPWFEDARVKTCAVILQRCDDQAEREAQLVKFVRLHRPLAELLGDHTGEESRQRAAEKLRNRIEQRKTATADESWRIIVRRQADLWAEGLRTSRILRSRHPASPEAEDDIEDAAEALHVLDGGDYGGGKWGKYLRAPDLYFRLKARFADRFVALGEIADIRFGVKSGCDDFFMPHDVTTDILKKYPAARWREVPLLTHCPRRAVESGEVRIILAGDETLHPIEAKYLVPEVHSLMKATRPVIRRSEIDRSMLYVSAPKPELKNTYVSKYIRYGETTSFASTKSKAVPVSERSTCKARDPWYDLTYTTPGLAFWPMAQQYRHLAPANPDNLVCNHNLFDVHADALSEAQASILPAILNSTLIGLTKTFFGRYAGTEGNLKTEVIDVNLLEIPDPRQANMGLARRLAQAFETLAVRDTQPLVENALVEGLSPAEAEKIGQTPVVLPRELTMPDRRALDLTVLELIGVADPKERESLLAEIYHETALHYRHVRIVELKKQEQRRGSAPEAASVEELAGEIWEGLEYPDKQPLSRWIGKFAESDTEVEIPPADAAELTLDDLVEPNSVRFIQRTSRGQRAQTQTLHFADPFTARLAHLLASEGFYGPARLPSRPEHAERMWHEVITRVERLSRLSRELADSRTGDEPLAANLSSLLRRWMLLGRPGEPTPAPVPEREVLGHAKRQPGYDGPATTDEWMQILRVGEDPPEKD